MPTAFPLLTPERIVMKKGTNSKDESPIGVRITGDGMYPLVPLHAITIRERPEEGRESEQLFFNPRDYDSFSADEMGSFDGPSPGTASTALRWSGSSPKTARLTGRSTRSSLSLVSGVCVLARHSTRRTKTFSTVACEGRRSTVPPGRFWPRSPARCCTTSPTRRRCGMRSPRTTSGEILRSGRKWRCRTPVP